MMYDAAGVPDLWTVMLKRNGHIERLRRLHLPMKGKVDQTVRDHIAIVEAIAAGDPIAAAREVRAHLSRSLAFIEGIRAHYPAEYFRD
ncbi:FCD domain-containing protein [Ferrovibrio sp.]|uniref:FCD domain-containing protein n=1 Tax=Ferrovibrio sp. TaxID=1917215 RepID=UPI0025B9AB0A|nr:FCD domain-containing protein [Ferrovibrio sp.]